MINKIAIVGSGSWATALVKIFSESGVFITWFVRSEQMAEHIRRTGRNPRYLPFASLNSEYIYPVSDFSEAFDDADLVIFALPSAYLEATIKRINKNEFQNRQIAVSIKGLVPGKGCTPSRFIGDYCSELCQDIMVLSGPCHAQEIACQKSTYLSVCSRNKSLVNHTCERMTCDYVHAIPGDDPIGVEYATILKNIIAIGCGIANGLHYGDNFQAVLVSNAMREAGQFLDKIEPGKRDLFQSAYFGDLLVTAYSEYSRNRSLGKLVGKGIQVNRALQLMEMVAEGFNASKELAPILKRHKINAPVLNSVYRILHLQANPFHEFKLLENQLN